MTTHDVIVVGGGPAGSTAAAIAAKRGLRVLLLESGAHPRLHVGESLLPGVIPILDEIGALAEVETAGFTRKTGATHWDWGRTPEWDLWFADTDEYDHAWLVERARFDQILFRAAARAGADAREHCKVTGLEWDGDRLAGVRHAGGVARAPVTIDASGVSSLLAHELGLRSLIPGLRHRASWAHYERTGRMPAPRENQALLAADARHWIWVFPLSDTLTSVGVVFEEDGEDAPADARAHDFERAVAANAPVRELLGPNARRITRVVSQRDWSYRMQRVAGPGWMLAGDASGFIDPILSTGVFLAMHAGAHAARTAAAIARGDRPEAAGLAEYQRAHTDLFDDILRIVKFFYRRNLDRADYFWESKAILEDLVPGIHPQKAFLILTSGLVNNLAVDERRAAVTSRREAALHAGPGARIDVDTHDPDELEFVCAHLEYRGDGEPAALFLLIEPARAGDPTLFATARWHINCLCPRYRNDPIQVPALAEPLRGLRDRVAALDTVDGESLAQFWRRTRGELVAALRGLPETFELVRVFGE